MWDKNARNVPFPSVEFLWKREQVNDFLIFTGRTRSGMWCLETGGDERVLSASEAEVRRIIPAKEFSARLDETLSHPTWQEPVGGRLLQRVSISPQVESNRRPRVIRFSGLAPAPRTSINSAARFHVRLLRKRPSNRIYVVSAHRHQLRGGDGGCWEERGLQLVPEGPRGRRGGRGDPEEDAAILKLSQCCWMGAGGRWCLHRSRSCGVGVSLWVLRRRKGLFTRLPLLILNNWHSLLPEASRPEVTHGVEMVIKSY